MNTLARPSPLPRPDRAAHTAPLPGQEPLSGGVTGLSALTPREAQKTLRGQRWSHLQRAAALISWCFMRLSWPALDAGNEFNQPALYPSRPVPGSAPITASLIQRSALPVGALETSPEASASGAFLGEVA